MVRRSGRCAVAGPVALVVDAEQLSDDGLELVGEPIDTGIVADGRWEGAAIEAPTMWADSETYDLFYSATHTTT